jgi:transposase
MEKRKKTRKRPSIDEKEKIVLEHLSKDATYSALSEKYGFHRWTIAIWCKSYIKHGKVGLLARSQEHNNNYSTEFKLKVFREIEKGVSLAEIKVKYLVSSGALCSWKKAYEKDGAAAFLNKKPRGRPPKLNNKMVMKSKPKSDKATIDEIRKENEYLRAENEYLKKLQALTQAQGKKPRPSKN